MSDTATWVLLRQRAYADLDGWSRSLHREMLDVFKMECAPLPLDLRQLAHLCVRSGREATSSVMEKHLKPLLDSGLVEETPEGYVPHLRPRGTPQIRMAGARVKKAHGAAREEAGQPGTEGGSQSEPESGADTPGTAGSVGDSSGASGNVGDSSGESGNGGESRGMLGNVGESVSNGDAELRGSNAHQTRPDPYTHTTRAREAPPPPVDTSPDDSNLPPPDRPPQVPEPVWLAYSAVKAAARSPWTMFEDEGLARLVGATADDRLLVDACGDLATKVSTGPPVQSPLLRMLGGYVNTQRRTQQKEAESGRGNGRVRGGRRPAHEGRWDDFIQPDPDKQDDPIIGPVEL